MAGIAGAQSIVGAGPYYQFGLVAQVGTVLETGVAVSNEADPSSNEAVPGTFFMNDGGDVLGVFKVLVNDPNHGDYTQLRAAFGAFDQLLLTQVDKPSVAPADGSLSDDRKIVLGNHIFMPGGSLIVPSGHISLEEFDDGGVPKPLKPVLPMDVSLSPSGVAYFTGWDDRVHDTNIESPVKVFELTTVGMPTSDIKKLTDLDYGPRWSTYPRAKVVVGDNGKALLNEYTSHKTKGPSDDRHVISVLKADGTRRQLVEVPVDDPDQGLSRTTALSGDGEFYAYVQWSQEGGQAIMVGQTDHSAPFAAPQVVFNQDSVIGLGGDAERTPVTMKEISLEGISLIRHNKGGPLNTVIAGDTLWIAFMGEPTAGSVPNPRVPGQPLLFRETMGLWALRVDIEETEGGELHLNASGPLPIVQLGDSYLGNPILEIAMSDSLARGTKDGDGAPRVPKKNDHVVAFRVRTMNQLALLRAIHFDDDEDGLPNHWEKPGGGIDSDRDGVPDLDLARFGADPRHKDMFLEVDWLSPRYSGYPVAWDVRPFRESLAKLTDIFATAPVANPDGQPGITLHIDAGPGNDPEGSPLTYGMGTATTGELQGGDEVTAFGRRPDVIRVDSEPMGAFGAFTVARLDVIKESYFGTADRFAREFAFRYAVLGDFHEITREIDLGGGLSVGFFYEESDFEVDGGNVIETVTISFSEPVSPEKAAWVAQHRWIGFANGRAGGEVRPCAFVGAGGVVVDPGSSAVAGLRFRLTGPPMPSDVASTPQRGDAVFFFPGNTGKAEAFVRQSMDPDAKPANWHRLGGNDLVISVSNLVTQFDYNQIPRMLARTMAHELGHTLALAHGGRSAECSHLGQHHWSLMSYSHQFRTGPGTPIEVHSAGCGGMLMPVAEPAGLGWSTSTPGVVWSFSDGNDPLGFNEWEYARLETWSVPWYLGNSLLKYRGAIPRDEHDIGPTYDPAGLGDTQAPRITWHLPAPPLQTGNQATLTVEFTATDNVGVTSLTVGYDADGDGTIFGAGEQLAPQALGNDRYRATFTTSGVLLMRKLEVRAADAAGLQTRLQPFVFDGLAEDIYPPYISFVEPAYLTALPLTGEIAVKFSVNDYGGGGHLRSWVRFDANGDGTISPEETVFANLEPGSFNRYVALLPSVTGPAGRRDIQIVSEDGFLNQQTFTTTVIAQELDTEAPALTISSGPADGSPLDFGPATLVFQLTASDAGGLKALRLSLDANGDGAIGPLESLEQPLSGAPTSANRSLSLSLTVTSGAVSGRLVQITATDLQNNTTTVTRTLQADDYSPPRLALTSHGDGDPVLLEESLAIVGKAADNAALAFIEITFDIDGDGIISAGERFTPEPAAYGDGDFTTPLPPVTGPAGLRELTLIARDAAGHEVWIQRLIETTPDVIGLPPEGERWRVGSSTLVSLGLPANTPQERTVRVRFDVNGDGSISGPLEDQTVPLTWPNAALPQLPRALAVLGSLDGPAGQRQLSVEVTGVSPAPRTVMITVEALPPAGVSTLHGHVPMLNSLADAIGDGNGVPTPVAHVGGITYFTARSPLEGTELWRSDGTAAGTYLLRDLDPGFFEGLAGNVAGSDPAEFAVFNGRLYFAASEQPSQTFTATLGTGRELWSTDGQIAGTQLVKDINPGRVPFQQSDSGSPQLLTVFNGQLWFLAQDGTSAPGVGPYRWWTSDGTTAGTTRWSDSPALYGVSPDRARPATAVLGNQMLFLENNGSELWATNGTANGTQRLYLQDGSEPRRAVFDQLVAANSRIYLRGFTGTHYELWTSDGTAAGTLRLTTMAPRSTNSAIKPPELAALGSACVFAGESPATGREIWFTEGTAASVRLLKDLWPGEANEFGVVPSGDPFALSSMGGRVLFSALSPTVGAEPWITDGTTEGTQVLADLARVRGTTETFSIVPPGSYPQTIEGTDQHAWISAGDDKRSIGFELWHWNRLGGSAPHLVRDLSPLAVNRALPPPYGYYTGPANSNPSEMMAVGSQLYFRATDPLYGDELFTSDGTAAGTRRLTNASGTTPLAPTLVRNSDVVVPGFDGLKAILSSSGGSPARSWATSRGADGGPVRGAPQQLTATGSGMAFVLPVKNEYGWPVDEVYRWEDSAAEPERVASFLAVWKLVAHGNDLWIAGQDSNGTQSLWRAVGQDPASMVTTLYGGNAALTLRETASVGGKLYFVASATADRELWVADVGGVRRVAAASGEPPYQCAGLTAFGGRLWFTGVTGFVQCVWSTDGSPAGTQPLANGYYRADWQLPEHRPAVVNGRLLFAAQADREPLQPHTTLWSTDGTAAGTVEITGGPGPTGETYTAEGIVWLTAAGDRVHFTANAKLMGISVEGEEPWVTDGTAAGTRYLLNLLPRGLGELADPSSRPRRYTALGNKVFFTATTSGESEEMWLSEGSTATTRLVRAIWPGVNTPSIDQLTAAGGKIWFAARSPGFGRELWVSDGTGAGTRMIEDLASGPMSGDPRLLGSAGDRLWFLARDGGDDRALRSLSLTQTTFPLGDTDSDGWSDALEALFLTSASDPTSQPRIEAAMHEPGSLTEAPRLQVSYRRPANWVAQGLSVGFEWSSNLSQWHPVAASNIEEISTEPAGVLERVITRVAVPAGDARTVFVRLKVQQP